MTNLRLFSVAYHGTILQKPGLRKNSLLYHTIFLMSLRLQSGIVA